MSAFLAWGCTSGAADGQGAGSGGSSGAGGSVASGGSTSASGGSPSSSTGGSSATGAGGTVGAGGGPGSGGSSGANTGGSQSGGSAGTAAGVGGAAGSTSGGGNGGSTTSDAGQGGGGSTNLTVNLGQPLQTMDGFGINNVFAPAMTDAVADRLFSTTNGIGLSILRIGMASNGTTLGNDAAGDIAKAKARGVTYIIGSVWSPPANCKTAAVLRGMTQSTMTENGGHLTMSCFDSWSTAIANFARSNGLYAMSIANEPDFQSCGTAEPCNGYYPTTVYTANEMVAFVKVASPKLRAAGVKVIAPEPSEWVHLWSNTSATGSLPSNLNSSDPLNCGFPATNPTCSSGGGYDYGHYLFRDSTAWAAVDILGVHQYDTQLAQPWPADVPDRKPLWETEMSGVKWWAEQGPSSDINDGLVAAGWIHDAIVNGPASAWLWWWYQAQGTNDNEGVVLQDGTVAKRLYTLGNFSKFIRPGYARVDITGSIPTGVLLTAYKGTDGTVVVVAINKGTASITVPISIAGGTVPASLTPWVTSTSDNLASKTAVTVSAGSFTAALAATTVTTFVGK